MPLNKPQYTIQPLAAHAEGLRYVTDFHVSASVLVLLVRVWLSLPAARDLFGTDDGEVDEHALSLAVIELMRPRILAGLLDGSYDSAMDKRPEERIIEIPLDDDAEALESLRKHQ